MIRMIDTGQLNGDFTQSTVDSPALSFDLAGADESGN